MLFSLLDETDYHLKPNTRNFSWVEALPACTLWKVHGFVQIQENHLSQKSELHNVLCRLAGVILYSSSLRNMYYGYSSYQVILIVFYNTLWLQLCRIHALSTANIGLIDGMLEKTDYRYNKYKKQSWCELSGCVPKDSFTQFRYIKAECQVRISDCSISLKLMEGNS